MVLLQSNKGIIPRKIILSKRDPLVITFSSSGDVEKPRMFTQGKFVTVLQRRQNSSESLMSPSPHLPRQRTLRLNVAFPSLREFTYVIVHRSVF